MDTTLSNIQISDHFNKGHNSPFPIRLGLIGGEMKVIGFVVATFGIISFLTGNFIVGIIIFLVGSGMMG